MKKILYAYQGLLLVVVVISLIALMGCKSATSSTTTTTSTTNTTTTSTTTSTSTLTTTTTSNVISTASTSSSRTKKSITMNVVAKSMFFAPTSISVPAGADVTIIFDNMDTGINHNIAVYQNLDGGQVKPVFVGEVVMGASTITYRFTAPSSPGNYFFQCDIHPQLMTGKFIIE